MTDEHDPPFQWGLTPRIPEPDAAAQVEPVTAPPAAPTAPDWDTPTVASPVLPASVFPLPEPPGSEIETQAFPAFGTPLDPALDGPTELLGALAVGLPVPQDEGLEAATLEDLFGESNFIEYRDEPIIPALAPRASSALALAPRASSALALVQRAPTPERASLQKTQKILLWVAGALVAALALVALFNIGLRTAHNSPAPVVVADPTPSASAPAGPLMGPIAAGDHHWDELLGGECLGSFESAWQDTYTVVDCSEPHPAQMVFTGLFAGAADVVFPGVDELQKRINLLCSAPAVIDYAAAAGASDIQVSASFAADDADWAAGNRAFYCFVNRAGGADFTSSIAVPQVAPVAG